YERVGKLPRHKLELLFSGISPPGGWPFFWMGPMCPELANKFPLQVSRAAELGVKNLEPTPSSSQGGGPCFCGNLKWSTEILVVAATGSTRERLRHLARAGQRFRSTFANLYYILQPVRERLHTSPVAYRSHFRAKQVAERSEMNSSATFFGRIA